MSKSKSTRARKARSSKTTERPTLSPSRIRAILNGKGPTDLRPYAELAKRFGVPLWVLMIPGLHAHKQLLTVDALAKLVKHVEDYLATEGAGERRVSKTTEPPNQQQRAEQFLLSQGQFDAVRKGYFCEIDRNLPIVGTPRPLSCPFCRHTDVSIVFKDHENGHSSAHAACDVCGVEGPYAGTETTTRKDSYDLALQAARLWNDREGKLVTESQS